MAGIEYEIGPGQETMELSPLRGPRCMTNAQPSLSPVLDDIDVSVVSAEGASLGVTEFWSGGRLIGFARIEDDVHPADRAEPRRRGASARTP